ncbi:uncharacterized protein LOC117516604 [Thalassophryne amazonica]|uniref:uncharacterized protein LOC117516604 n=1 Tax=Thalassophryne amazonica TaxID=390379 RepID=UPI0014715664|nr:uncharacterized protein LOC117516604 [Thalassophryne amazonica]
MKVPNILLLLFFIDAVDVLLFGPQEVSTAPVDHEDGEGSYSGVNMDTGAQQNDLVTNISVEKNLHYFSSPSEATTLRSAESPTAGVPFPVTSSSAVIPDASSPCGFRKDKYLTLLMVAGGLMIACVILLVSTVILALKVCQMSRRIKTSDAILIRKSECRTNAGESTAETEANDTTILMNDIGQTQMGDGAPNDEDKHKDGQTGQEGGETHASNTAHSPDALASGNQEMPVAAAESTASPTPLGGATDSPATNANIAPSTEGLKESKE